MVPPTRPPTHTTPHPSKGEQHPGGCDSDRYPEEAQGGWEDSQDNTHDYSHPSWDDWDAEPSWDAGGAQVGQGGWVDGGEAQVGSNRWRWPSLLCQQFHSNVSFPTTLNLVSVVTQQPFCLFVAPGRGGRGGRRLRRGTPTRIHLQGSPPPPSSCRRSSSCSSNCCLNRR